MPKALEDVTVLDFSHLLQGPFATQLLGDMGANIIKVERPGQGDLFRTMTFKNRWVGGTESPNFLAWNRNKRSLAHRPQGAGGARRCSTRSPRRPTSSLQNFRPGVMERLGYGYEDFRAINPRIIYCSGSGYGDSGPYVSRPGQDMLIQGLTGLAAATGRGDGPPVPVGAGFADQIGALNIVYGMLTRALLARAVGRGPGDQDRPHVRAAAAPEPGDGLGDELRRGLRAAELRRSGIPAWMRRSASTRRATAG